jgi:glycerol kinase
VLIAETAEMTATGAAHLAGLQAGAWTQADLDAQRGHDRIHEPRLPADARRILVDRWHRALWRALDWEDGTS